MVFIDTVTKGVGITKHYYADTTGCAITDVQSIQIIRGIFLGEAWKPGYLMSRYFGRIVEKYFTYSVVIIVCHAGRKWLPVLDLMWLHFAPSTVFPASASIGVFLVELSSINENLKEMGQTGIFDLLERVISTVTNKILPKQGGNQ